MPTRDPGSARESPGANDTRKGGRPERLVVDTVLVLLVLASIASVARIGMFGAFMLDDLPMIAVARAHSWPSPAYLLGTWNGHLAPGGMLFLWCASRAFALSRPAYGALSALLFVFPVTWFAWSTRRMLGPTREAILVVLLFCSSSAVLVACGMWCSVVTNGGPFALAGIVVGLDLLASNPAPTRRDRGFLAMAALSPLLFWDKAVLLPSGLFAAAVGWDEQPLRAAIPSVWRRWRGAWIACLVVAPSWLALAAWANVHRAAPSFPVSVPTAARFVELVSAAVTTGFPMAVLGGPAAWYYLWQQADPVGWQLWSARVALLALGALCIFASHRSRWLFSLAVGWLIGSAALVFAFRARFGDEAVAWVRYWSDCVPWFCFAATAAFLDVRSSRVPGRSPAKRHAADAACLAILSIAGLAWTRTIRAAWPDRIPTIIASIEALPEGTALLDHPLEGPVGLILSFNASTPIRVSHLFAGTSAAGRISDGPADLFLLNDTLDPFRARVEGPVRRVESCLDPAHPALRVPVPRHRGPLFLRIRGEAFEPVGISASIDGAPGGRIHLSPGQLQSHTWVAGGGTSLTLRLEEGTRACLRDLAIGDARPLPPPRPGGPPGGS